MKIVLAGDTLNRTNWGCRATSTALRSLLADAGGELDAVIDTSELLRRLVPARRDIRIGDLLPGEPFGLLERDGAIDSRSGRSLGNRLRTAASRLAPSLVPASGDQFEATWARWIKHPELADWVESLHRSDLLVINGEGAILGNKDAGRLLLFLAWAMHHKVGKRVALVNHMCDLGSPAMRSCADLAYPIIDHVVVRDEMSLKVARGAGALSATYAPDVAFTLAPSPREAFTAVGSSPEYFAVYPNRTGGFDPAQPYVCLGASARFRWGKTGRQKPGDLLDGAVSDWYVDIATELSKSVQVLLMGHDIQDHALFARIADEHGLPFIGIQSPIRQVLDLLAHSNVYVGGRWHSAILAATGAAEQVLFPTNSRVKTEGMVQLLQANGRYAADGPLPAPAGVVAATLAALDAPSRPLRVELAELLADAARANVAAFAPTPADAAT